MRYEREDSEILNLYYMLLEYYFLIKIKDTQFVKLFSLGMQVLNGHILIDKMGLPIGSYLRDPKSS